jgi:hypothetical protein
MDAIQQRATGIGHLLEVIQAHSFPEAHPFKGHAGSIRTQNLLSQIVQTSLLVEVPLLSQIRLRM